MDKINDFDLTCLSVNLICTKFLLAYTRKIMLFGGNASWMIGIYATVMMLLIFFVITKIYDFKYSIFEAVKIYKNKALPFIIGVVVTISIFFSFVSLLRTYPESVKIILLHDTPFESTLLVVTIAIIIAAICGIFAISKITSLFMPIILFFAGLFSILILIKFNINNLFPIFGLGLKKLLIGGVIAISAFSELIILYIIVPKCNKKVNFKKCGYKSIIISGIILTLIMLFYSASCPYPISNEFLFPVYRMTKLMSLGGFFERFEAVFEFAFTFSIMITFSIYIYIITVSWKEAFALKYDKPLIMPMTFIGTYLSLSTSSYLKMSENYVIYSIVTGCASIIIPILVGILYKIGAKRKGLNERD